MVPSYNYSLELPVPSIPNTPTIPLIYSDYNDLEELFPYNCVYFNNGNSLPAGRYKIKYKTGCVQYFYTDPTEWKVNNVSSSTLNQFKATTIKPDINDPYTWRDGLVYNGSEDEVGFIVCFTPDGTHDSVGKKICTGTNSAKASQSLSIIDNIDNESDVTFYHLGGPIAIYFHSLIPGLSSSSSPMPDIEATPSIEGLDIGPEFILIRMDDPADYECGEDAPVFHKKSFYTHFKRPVDGSFSLQITINNNSDLGQTPQTIQIFYRGTDVTQIGGGAKTILGGQTIFDTIIIPYDSGEYSSSSYPPMIASEDEILEIIVDGTITSDYILNWTVEVSCPGCPPVPSPTNLEYVQSGNEITFTWDTVPDSINGIINNYDLYVKQGSVPDPLIDTPSTTIIQTENPSVTLNLTAGVYYWLVVANSSCGYASATPDPLGIYYTVIIKPYEVSNICVRPTPVDANGHINRQIKIHWEEGTLENISSSSVSSDTTVNAFLISRGLGYYDTALSKHIFTWQPFCIWNRISGATVFEMFVDITKNSQSGMILSCTQDGVSDTIPSTSDFLNIDGLTDDQVRRITLKAENPPSPDIPDTSHYELWYKIEALSNKIMKGDLKYILIGSQGGVPGTIYHGIPYGVSCISTKTQYIAGQQYGLSPTSREASQTNELLSELDELWNNNQAQIPLYTPAGKDASRTAIDLLATQYNREISGWVAFRNGNSIARYNLLTGEIRQLWINTNLSAIKENPRGITINSKTGNAYVAGGDSGGSSSTNYMCELEYDDSMPSGTPIIYTSPTDPTIIPLNSSGDKIIESYGSTQDKFNNIWFMEAFKYITKVNNTTGGRTRIATVSDYYGITTDFYGDIWGTEYNSRGNIYRVPINSDGSLDTLDTVSTTRVGHYGISADIPVDNHFNIWACGRDTKITKLNLTHEEYTSGGITHNTIILNSTDRIDVTKIVPGQYPKGVAFTSENDIIISCNNSAYIIKIYQKLNDDSWPNGGNFRYNDKRVLYDGVTILQDEQRYYYIPLGPNKEDDIVVVGNEQTFHPMWHACYDVYDTDYNNDVTQMNRYKAWKALNALYANPGEEIPGIPLKDIYQDNTRPTGKATGYKRTPNYNPTTNNFPVVDYVEGWSRDFGLNGIKTETLQSQIYSLEANQDVPYNVSIFHFDLLDTTSSNVVRPNWQSYIYSDFIGGVSAFIGGEFPLTQGSRKYTPLISKIVG